MSSPSSMDSESLRLNRCSIMSDEDWYTSDEDRLMSESVSSVAAKIYEEFERMIHSYGEEVVENLTPIVVCALKEFESATIRCKQQSAEYIVLAEDRNNLLAVFEREKQSRNQAELNYFELEDIVEQERRDHKMILEKTEQERKKAEASLRNMQDQLERLEERLRTERVDYNKLHTRYSEMIQASHRERQSLKAELSEPKFDLPKSRMRLVRSTVSTESIPMYTEPLPPAVEFAPAPSEVTEESLNNVSIEEEIKNASDENPTGIDDDTTLPSTPKPDAATPTDVSSVSYFTARSSSPIGSRPSCYESTPLLFRHIGENITPIPESRSSLYRELSDAVSGSQSMLSFSCTGGISEDFQVLLAENQELIRLRNELVQEKNELLSKVAELNSEKTLASDMLDHCSADRSRLQERVTELQQEVKRLRVELSKCSSDLKPKSSQEEEFSKQRSFTRAEVSRLIIERNIYKERLFELQEAVRWSQMLRDYRKAHLAEVQKKPSKSKFLNMFSRFFQNETSRAEPISQLNILPTSQSRPPVEDSRKPLVLGSLGDKSKRKLKFRSTLGVQSDTPLYNLGWLTFSPKTSSSRRMPPSFQQARICPSEPAFQLWCASYIAGREPSARPCTVPPLVWMGFSSKASSKVMIINPTEWDKVVCQFDVCQSFMVCITWIPGFSETDYKGDVEGRVVTGSLNLSIKECSAINSARPTMWIGSRTGRVFVHSAVDEFGSCLLSVKLKSCVFQFVHCEGRVAVALGDGTVVFFSRFKNGKWDLLGYHEVALGKPAQPVRCLTVVNNRIWAGFSNKICVLDPEKLCVEHTFDASPEPCSHVRQMVCCNDGVWVSFRVEGIIRLFHARFYNQLQDVDLEPYVHRSLASPTPDYSSVRVTALCEAQGLLWVGTSYGLLLAIPITRRLVASGGDRLEDSCTQRSFSGSCVPFCSMADTLYSIHGHQESVKFILSLPGDLFWERRSSSCTSSVVMDSTDSQSVVDALISPLIISGGQGYDDFVWRTEDSTDQPIVDHLPSVPILTTTNRPQSAYESPLPERNTVVHRAQFGTSVDTHTSDARGVLLDPQAEPRSNQSRAAAAGVWPAASVKHVDTNKAVVLTWQPI